MVGIYKNLRGKGCKSHKTLLPCMVKERHLQRKRACCSILQQALCKPPVRPVVRISVSFYLANMAIMASVVASSKAEAVTMQV